MQKDEGFKFINLIDDLPPLITRGNVAELLGIKLSAKTLANLDSLGEGPSERVKIGKEVAYPKRPLLIWMDKRTKFCRGGQNV